MVSRRLVRAATAAVLILMLGAPFPVWSAVVSFGTARGVRSVQWSVDGGKSWLPLGSRALPVLDGAEIRATSGGAMLDLTDGSRLNLLPFSSLRLRDTGATTEVSLLYGRVTFRLPAATKVEMRTTAARLVPLHKQAMAGEAFVGSDGTVGLRMTEGALQVEELTGARRAMLASLEPVFLPKRPTGSGPLFATEAAAVAPPAGAKSVFSPAGESLGYLQGDGQLVVYPGYTSDLTQPFPARLVQVAMGKVPEKDRSDAMPVFDVNGGYVGYLAGPVFYAQAQVAQAVGAGGGGGAGPNLYAIGGGLLGLGALGGGVAWGASRGNGPGRGCGFVSSTVPPGPPATPVGPCR